MARRSRKLPIASGPGTVDLTINEADWQRIETAYGKKLSCGVRNAVLGATRGFVVLDICERQAEPVADAEKIIDVCKKAAGNFQCALLATTSSSDVASYVRDLIAKNFHDTRLSNKDQLFNTLISLLNSFRVACDSSLTELNVPSFPPFGEGECWKYWIPRLTEIMQEAGLPTGVRKDTDKRKSDKPSPFVALVRELQECLPDGCRKTTHSDDALAEAITRVPFRVK